MTKFKRSLSTLLAIVMVFTTMTIAFTVVSAAVPNVPRVAKTTLSPTVIFTVPQYLQTFGSSIYQPGLGVRQIGEVQATITSTTNDPVENISLTCSDGGVQMSPRQQSASGESVWLVQGGTLKTAADEDGTTVVKWTLSCTVGGKTYHTYAWSQVRPVYNNPGFATYLHHKYSGNFYHTFRTHNHHLEWIGPVMGDPATEQATNFTQCYLNEGAGTFETDTGVHASSYYWEWDRGSGDNLTSTASVMAKGTLYADLSQDNVSTVQELGLASCAKPNTALDTPDERPQTYYGTSIIEQYYHGSTVSGVYTVSDSGHNKVAVGEEIGGAFMGPLPSKGKTAEILAQIKWEGQITRTVLHPFVSWHDSVCKYDISIVSYDKSALWTALSNATEKNYQQSQFRTTAPSGTGSKFRSWDQYLAALQNAWYIYGRKDVTQSDIDDAVTLLTNASPKYDADSGSWVSGMMYNAADYSQIDSIIAAIPQTLEPSFYEDYSDGTHGKYYQFTRAAVLLDALEDINYDKGLLDARYQSVVDQMRMNLSNAITDLVETPEVQTTKLVDVEFDANQDGVSNMPDTVTTSLIGQVAKPTVNPSKQYYKFTGWYYDAETTKPVLIWPLNINPADGYFKANLDTKVDHAGVAYTLYAGWSVTGKTLTFDTQGGSEIPTAVGENGQAYSGPTETPTKPGCLFLGWYTDAACTTPVNWDTFTFGSLSVVYAKWTADRYTVTFYANGGAFPDGSTTYIVTDLFGSPVEAPTPPTKTGVGFNGWYYDAALTQPVDMSTFTIPSYNVTLYAFWDNTVRNVVFDAQDGTEPIVMTYALGGRVERPADPVREGYDFMGWYTNPRGLGSPKTFPFNVPSQNTTLYGIWSPHEINVEFAFAPEDADASMAASFDPYDYTYLPCGSELVPPEDPTKPEYVFSYWKLEGETEPYTFTTVPAHDIKLIAVFEEEPYVATFRLRTDAGSSVAQGDVITATVSMQANRVVSTFGFIVYYDKNYLVPCINGKAVTTQISGQSACSKTPNKAYFTLIQDPGGVLTNSGSPTGRITPGNIAAAGQFFPADWVKDNRTLLDAYNQYEFVYFTSPDVSSGTRVRPNGEVDVASFQFLVREDAELADGVSSYAQILLSPDFTRTPDRTAGKTAACLTADAVYNNAKDWDKTTNVVVDGDHRFAVTQMETCCINFITNGGEAVAAIENAKQGGTATLPTPKRDYYDFLGWTLTNDANDTNYVNQNSFPVPNADSVTLYAKWVGKTVKYYVRHHKQNLSASGFLDTFETTNATAQVGTTVTATPKTYAGFTCSNPNESGVVRGEAANLLYLDLWYMRNTTTITLDANGGKFQNGQQMVALTGLYENTVTNAPADPTREGYVFSGWDIDNALFTISTYPAESVTATAGWQPKTITVRFFLNGDTTTPYVTKLGRYGDALEAPTVTPGAGQVFSGWKNANGVPFSYTTFPANNEDFYGSVDIDGYRLTLFVNGTQRGDPIEVLNGTQVTEASISNSFTVDPGYRFTGWRTENSRDGQLAAFPMTLSADTTLYGFTERETYRITTTVYLYGEPEEGPSVENLFYGASFDLPEPEDYTEFGLGFRGWYTDVAMTKLYQKPDTMPAQNIVLYGEYYEMTGTIKFDLNGGSGTAPANIVKPVGQTVTLPGGTGVTRQFYTFGGWSTSKTGTTPLTKYTIIGEDTVTMYAIWKVNYATLTFNLNGAESGTTPENMQVELNVATSAAKLPSGADFVKTGYIFSGWSDTQTATTALESYTATSVGTKRLYAVWVADTATLVVRDEGATPGGNVAVIDDTHGYVYGLDFNVTEDDVRNSYLDVIGNGHLEFEYTAFGFGTGTVIKVINDYTGNVDATYTIIIFGDLNGDGLLNTSDVTAMRSINASMTEYEDDSPFLFAADVTHDGLVNTSDITAIRSANAQMADIDQSASA